MGVDGDIWAGDASIGKHRSLGHPVPSYELLGVS